MVEKIEDIANKLVSGGKGILAADESNATIGKRFAALNVETSYEMRRDYREMLFSCKEALQNYISGVILYDETIKQEAKNKSKLIDYISEAGAVIGIKVDTGAKELPFFPSETITEGLDGLRQRLVEYYEMGARFAKWRGVITLDSVKYPTYSAVRQNAQALARYAALCQECNIVPIVEPEILMDSGAADHSIDRCYEVTKSTLRTVFDELFIARVKLEGMVLKPNMVIDGKKNRVSSVDEVAEKTVKCLKEVVPASVPGIAFLSGGQSEIEATAHLNAMNAIGSLPWKLTFSYGRALQAPSLKAWVGLESNITKAQELFSKRAKMNSLAAQGKWSEDLEG